MTAARLTLPAEPLAAGQARRAVTAFARENEADEGTVAAMVLALSEAVTNVILHAYRDRPTPGDFSVTAERDRDDLCVLVRDDGVGMSPRLDSPGLGMGLSLIGRLTYSMEVRARPEGGTDIRMRFPLTPGTPGGPASTAAT